MIWRNWISIITFVFCLKLEIQIYGKMENVYLKKILSTCILKGQSFLIDRNIKLVGIDYLSIENYGSLDHATHHLLLRNNVVILEGIDLSRISTGRL